MRKIKIDRVTKAKLDDIILQGQKDDDPVKSFCLEFVYNDEHECWITTTYQSGKTDDERYFDKTMNQLALDQCPLKGGCIVLPADYESVIDPNIVDNFACWSKTYTLDLSDIGILTDKEKEYLKAVIEPYKLLVVDISKISGWNHDPEQIFIFLQCGDPITIPIILPELKFSGMKLNKSYTLEELDL